MLKYMSLLETALIQTTQVTFHYCPFDVCWVYNEVPFHSRNWSPVSPLLCLCQSCSLFGKYLLIFLLETQLYVFLSLCFLISASSTLLFLSQNFIKQILYLDSSGRSLYYWFHMASVLYIFSTLVLSSNLWCYIFNVSLVSCMLSPTPLGCI